MNISGHCIIMANGHQGHWWYMQSRNTWDPICFRALAEQTFSRMADLLVLRILMSLLCDCYQQWSVRAESDGHPTVTRGGIRGWYAQPFHRDLQHFSGMAYQDICRCWQYIQQLHKKSSNQSKSSVVTNSISYLFPIKTVHTGFNADGAWWQYGLGIKQISHSLMASLIDYHPHSYFRVNQTFARMVDVPRQQFW